MSMKATFAPVWSEAPPQFKFDFDSNQPGTLEIADWLESDAPDRGGAQELLRLLTNTPSGERLYRGEDHEVLVIGDDLLIECLYVYEQKVLITRKQALSILQQHIAFLDELVKKTGELSSFEVEYEAGGEDALTKYQALGGKEALTLEDMESR